MFAYVRVPEFTRGTASGCGRARARRPAGDAQWLSRSRPTSISGSTRCARGRGSPALDPGGRAGPPVDAALARDEPGRAEREQRRPARAVPGADAHGVGPGAGLHRGRAEVRPEVLRPALHRARHPLPPRQGRARPGHLSRPRWPRPACPPSWPTPPTRPSTTRRCGPRTHEGIDRVGYEVGTPVISVLGRRPSSARWSRRSRAARRPASCGTACCWSPAPTASSS